MSDPQDQPDAGAAELMPPKHIVDFAVEVSQWAPCRSKRGVVIFGGINIVGHGYNYKPRGFDCDGSDTCKATCRVEAVHAEQQALLSVGYHANGCDLLHVKTLDGKLVPSGGPSCVQCSKLALVAGIAGVWLYHDTGWRRYDAPEFHRLSLGSDAGRPVSPPSLSEQLQALAWCGNSVYHDEFTQGRFDDRCGMCRRNTETLRKVVALVQPAIPSSAALPQREKEKL